MMLKVNNILFVVTGKLQTTLIIDHIKITQSYTAFRMTHIHIDMPFISIFLTV